MKSARVTLSLLLVVSATLMARADKLDVRARYEERLIEDALDRTGLHVDPEPVGKTIEGIVVVANDVILPGDYAVPYRIPLVYPLLARVTWANKLHVRTRPYIIKQELLFKIGDRFRSDVFEETGRNLRNFFVLAVARLVVTKGTAPDRVIVLVVTKDNWTLRLNSNFTLDQARLDALSLSISESNLAGRNKTSSIEYALDPGRHAVGFGYTDPRMGGSRHQLRAVGGLYISRERGDVEGGYGQLTLGRPLYSLRTQWGWQLDLNYLQDIARTFQGGNLRQLKYGDELIPDAYARREITGNLVGTRSFGVIEKLNLSLGFRVTSLRYGLPDDFPEALSPAARQAYLDTLPRTENTSGPFISASAFRASYVRLQNINSFALSEDFRLGPVMSLEARFVDPVFGFDSRFLAVSGSYGATYFGRDNLVSFNFSGSARLQAGIVEGESWVNQVVTASVKEVTPRFGPFRIHIGAVAQLRRNDVTKARLAVGSSNGLRGFAPRQFVGNNFYRVNVELRSVALNLWTVHIGGVLFYDGGDAPQRLTAASWHHDVGVGLRILFPQFNKEVLRIDCAFPIDTPPDGSRFRFSVEFGQAF